MRRVLRLPAYGRLLAAYTLNDLAWSIGSLALAVLVYRRTGSAVGATAYFLCAQFIPALAAPWLVARLDQRAAGRVLPVLYVIEAAMFLALAWVASHFSLAPVLALTVADGVVALTARPLARAATVAVSAPAGLLREANALTNASFSISFMAGPAIGGVVVASGGTVAALLVNCGLFMASALTLITARGLPGAAPQHTAPAVRLRAALAHARSRQPVRVLLALQATAVLIFTIVVPVAVVYAERSLHAGAAGYGALLAAWGGGAVVGSAVYARWRALPSGTLIALAAAALGLGMVVMASASAVAIAAAGAVLGGAGNGIEAVAARTALQEQVEQRWMTLIMSLNESMLEAVPGAGILLGGAITAVAGPRVALAIAGSGALAIAAAAPAVLRRARVSEKPPAKAPAGPGTDGVPKEAARR